jgi:hypothetical protein
MRFAGLLERQEARLLQGAAVKRDAASAWHDGKQQRARGPYLRAAQPLIEGEMMMKHHTAVSLALRVAGLALVSSPALSFGIESPQDAIVTPGYMKNMRTLTMMDKIDANGDHMVTKEEGEAYFSKIFDMLDHDHDGTLDRKEWTGAAGDSEVIGISDGGYARALSSMQMMKMVDTDNDHTVSKEEFLKAHEALFNKMAGGQSSAIDVQHWLGNHFPK